MKTAADKTKKIVVIGGGTGVFTVLSGLRAYPVELSAVVSMADDGGSSGVLREEFGILPPGDVRRVLVALSHTEDRLVADLFNYRFEQGNLKGHTFGNIMLTALERLTGSFEDAVYEAGRLLNIRGHVLPVTLSNVKLGALLENGRTVMGETNIDVPKHDPELKIKRVFLSPKARANKRAIEKIRTADLIVIGPGDLYTSIVPNLIVSGIPEAIRNSKAKKAYVVNLMTKSGETNKFDASQFVSTIEAYLGKRVLDYAVVNTRRPSLARLTKYSAERSEFVGSEGMSQKPTPIFGDFLREKGFLRHDPKKLASVLVSLL